MHFVFVSFEVRKSCSYDQTTQAVADKGKPTQLGSWTRLTNVLLNLLCKLLAHLKYVYIRVVFISLST